jgi:hypothetical protein
MKIFPGFVAIPGLIWEGSRAGGKRSRGFLAFAAVSAVGAAVWLAIGGKGAIASLTYHGERGLEIGSLYSGILMALRPLTGWQYAVTWDHGSYNLTGPWARDLARLSGLVQVAAVGATLARFAATGFRSGMRFTLGVLVATIATAKLLSPQYFIWLLPFVVALDGRVGRYARPLYAAVCVLTLVIYPPLLHPLTRLDPLAILVLNLRNVLALALWGLVTFAPERPDVAPKSAPPS